MKTGRSPWLLQGGGDDAAFLLGSGFELYLAWLAAAVAGFFASAAIPDPNSIGLDFAFTAVFLALLVGVWSGQESRYCRGLARRSSPSPRSISRWHLVHPPRWTHRSLIAMVRHDG